MNSTLKYTEEVIKILKVRPARSLNWLSTPINMTFSEWLKLENLPIHIPKIKEIKNGVVVFENKDAWKHQIKTEDKQKSMNLSGLFIAVTETQEIMDEEAFNLYNKKKK